VFDKYRVRRALNKLTAHCSEPDEIADRLYGMGIKGIIADSEKCPIVNYIKEKTGVDVRVKRQYVSTAPYAKSSFTMENHLLIQEFISRFDDDQYPLLDDEYPLLISVDDTGREEQEEDA
jgi:hypothetical protein